MTNKKFKHVIPLLFFLGFVLLFQAQLVSNDEDNDQSEEAKVSLPPKSAEQNEKNIERSVAQQHDNDNNSKDDNETHEDSSILPISKNNPMKAILDRFQITTNDHFIANEDHIFFSRKYSLIHENQNPRTYGKIVENSEGETKIAPDNYKLVKLDNNQKNLPPLLISYSTNRPIPITGNLLVKFYSQQDLSEMIKFLKDEFEEIDQIETNKNLTDLHRVLVRPHAKAEAHILYQKLNRIKGKNKNIEGVEFDVQHQFTTN